MFKKMFYLSIIIFLLSSFITLSRKEKKLYNFSFNNSELAASIKRGKKVYLKNCASCHMINGQGIKGTFPPLAKADYLMADKARSIRQVIYGLDKRIVVNGVAYQMAMPAQKLNNQEVADVLNYVRNTWGNKGEIVRASEVKLQRK